MTERNSQHWYFQFSLWTLLVVVTLFAIACSWLAVKIRQARREGQVVAEIEELGGEVTRKDSGAPRWLRTLLGDDFFVTVIQIRLLFSHEESIDTQLELLNRLDQTPQLLLSFKGVTEGQFTSLERLNKKL